MNIPSSLITAWHALPPRDPLHQARLLTHVESTDGAKHCMNAESMLDPEKEMKRLTSMRCFLSYPWFPEL